MFESIPWPNGFWDWIGFLAGGALFLVLAQMAFGAIMYGAMMALGGIALAFSWLWSGVRSGDLGPILTLAAIVFGVGLVIGTSGGEESVSSTSAPPSVTFGADLPPETRGMLSRAYDTLVANLWRDSLAREWLEDTGSDDIVSESATLANVGSLRLPDSAVLERFRLTARIVERASPEVCAAIGQARVGDPAIFLRGLGQLDQSELSRWFDVSERAIIAELQETPPRVTSDSLDLRQAGKAVVSQIGGVDVLTLRRVFAEDADPSASDVCDATRALLSAMTQVAREHQIALARSLMSGGEGL